ncbi:MAG: hypothetical protein AB8B63_09345 [Granulosicoccus sp.]
MPNLPHPHLDLAGKIRPGLDILANEIVIALKKRTRFPTNAAVYIPGLVLSQPAKSLLEVVLNDVESCHASLGRYTFAEQEAFTPISGVMSIIQREPTDSPLYPMASNAGEKIIGFYRQWLTRACVAGEDTDTYGQTATSDVDALLAIMERVNLGKPVAEAKFLEQPEAFVNTAGDRDAMLDLLVKKDREAQVLELAVNLAQRYDLPEEHAVDVFNFMIKTTIDIEIDYLRMRIKSG